MFMLMFGLGLIGFITGAFRLFSCFIIEKIKCDRFSPHRKRVWRNVWIHYIITFLLFYLSYRL